MESHDLSECELYTSCEPCPMCWGAIQWSRVKKVYTGVDRFTAAKFGFDDKVFYDEVTAQAGHYAVKLDKANPGDQPAMLDIYADVEPEKIQAILADPSVNLTYRRRRGLGAVQLPDDSGRFDSGANQRRQPDKRVRSDSMAAKDDAAAAVAAAAAAAVAVAAAGGGEPAGCGGEVEAVQCQPCDLPADADHAKFMGVLAGAVRNAVKMGTNKEREVFASCVVKDGEVLCVAVNEVVKKRNATATSEVQAVQRASKILGTYNLEGCSMYTTIEPDVMSLGAVLWSRMDRLFFACSQLDAAKYGFEEGEGGRNTGVRSAAAGAGLELHSRFAGSSRGALRCSNHFSSHSNLSPPGFLRVILSVIITQ
jgi:tRNA(Arg) A34 adenosine deaminase TadA